MSSPKPLLPVVSRVAVDDLHIQLILSNQGITLNIDHVVDEDEAMILALGYKQELHRGFDSLWSIFSVSFAVLGLLPSIGATFGYQQLVIGISPLPWLLAMIFITCVALSLAEISSKFPTASGTPYAVYQLSPPRFKPLFTWLTCFSNWMCQITAAPSVNYSGALMILALYSLNSSSYTPTNGQLYALTTGIQVSHAIISSLPSHWLSHFLSCGNIANCVFLFVVFIMLLTGNRTDQFDISKFNTNSVAWSFTNQTDFPSGIATLCSFLGAIWLMSGYDSPFHLSEECSHPSIIVPKAIVMTSAIGGLVGWFFMIAIAYTIVDLDTIALDPQGLGQPFVTYLTQILPKTSVNAATALTIISSWFMGSSCMLAASRVTYAYARDDMFPLSRLWKQVNLVTSTPIYAVFINFVVGQLLLLLMLAGDTAVGAIFSVGGISGFVSFTAPTLLKITYARNTFEPGPWNLGRFSQPIGWISVAFVTLMIPILCFPTVSGSNLTPDAMNWTVVVFFGPMLMALVWFWVDAHKWYKGPKTNIDPNSISYDPVEEDGSEDTGYVKVIDGVDTGEVHHDSEKGT